VTGDFNGDSFQDLAVANLNGNTVTIMLGNGLGGFTAAPGSPFTAGKTPYSVMVGDFDGNGVPDLAVSNSGDNTVTVLPGTGTGAFNATAGSPIAVGKGPYAVVVGDFNGDGIQDLATANAAATQPPCCRGTAPAVSRLPRTVRSPSGRNPFRSPRRTLTAMGFSISPPPITTATI
jgi:hypothetical protein